MKIINKQLLLFLSIVLLSSCTVFYDDALPNQEISKYPERVGVINKAITETPPAEKKPIVAVYPTSFTDQTDKEEAIIVLQHSVQQSHKHLMFCL